MKEWFYRFQLSVDHVIIEVLKFASNLKIGSIVYLLFCFLPCQKKKELLLNIFIVITQPFLYLEGALKLISQEQFKTQQPKYSKFDANFQVRRKYLHFDYDMIYALISLPRQTEIMVLEKEKEGKVGWEIFQHPTLNSHGNLDRAGGELRIIQQHDKVVVQFQKSFIVE